MQPTHLNGINSCPSMIGERVCFYIGLVLLKHQPSCLYQNLDLVFQGNALFDRVAWGSPMVCAGHARVTRFRERRLVDPSRSHHNQLVGNEKWQEVPVRHWDQGEFRSLPWWRVPRRVRAYAKVGIAGRASRGWSWSLGGLPLDGGGRSRLYGC